MHYKLRNGDLIDLDQLSEEHQDLVYDLQEHYETISKYEAPDRWGHFEWATYNSLDEAIRKNDEHPVELIRRDLRHNLMIMCGMVGEPSEMFVSKDFSRYSSKLGASSASKTQ